ncbi:unnamed protein product [Prunus armeniaca]|uniref:F-box domain-containing protein n=1 Tax=Prunus armeniaca TaxID=36596 RepID=A0A6J5U1T1_PRUAR|nr:unnamed protein product [Prunus armeniaca]
MMHINSKNEKKQPKLNLMTMGALPLDILIDILSRMSVNSICCMRCVSKALLRTVDDPSLATMHMRRRFLTTCSTTTTEVPRLVVLDESPYHKQNVLYPLKYDGNDLLTKSKHAIVSYFGSRQCFYSHAFVFCNLFGFTGLNPKHGRSCLLVNPFKGEVLMLPFASDVLVPANSLYSVDYYGMGFDNITNSFKIVRVSSNKKDYMVSEILVLGTSSWRALPTVPPCFPTSKSAYAHGDIHWLVYGDGELFVRILSFDFKKEEFYWMPHPAPLGKKPDLWNFLHLINLRGSLALVNVSSPENKHMTIFEQRPYIEIWELKNYDVKEWVLNYKIYSEQCLFIFWKPASFSKCEEWEHGIFFNQESWPNNCIFLVDLRHVSINCILLKGEITIHSCIDSIISLNNYGDLIEAEEEQGITEFPMPHKTWENLINSAEESGRDFCYLKTQKESASISWDRSSICI